MESTDWTIVYTAILCFIIILPVLIHKYLQRKFGYWKRKGIPQVNPSSYLYGNIKEIFYGRKYTGYIIQDLYRQLEGHSCGGFYEFVNPVLMIREPELLQTILVEKFSNFQDCRPALDEEDLLSRNPFFQVGTKWKETRTLLSAGLTPLRIKFLDDIIKSVYNDMSEYIDKNITCDIEGKELSRRYTCNVVAAWGWGISGDAFSKNSVVKSIFDKFKVQCFSSLVNNLQQFWPQVGFLLGKKSILAKELTDSLINLTDEMIKTSNKDKNITLLDSLLHSRDKYRGSEKEISFTTEDITGYLISYYLDAYESVGNLIDLVLYQLMLHPKVQQKLREEVLKMTQVTVDSVNKLEYMEMVIAETGRLCTLFPILRRICTEKFRLGKVDIDIGTIITIPAHALHHDPKYYPNPSTFNPENFSAENKEKRHKFTYFPFGQGPRACLGMKYALSKIKMLFAYLLKDYEILPPKDKPISQKVIPSPQSRFYVSQQELFVRFKKLK